MVETIGVGWLSHYVGTVGFKEWVWAQHNSAILRMNGLCMNYVFFIFSHCLRVAMIWRKCMPHIATHILIIRFSFCRLRYWPSDHAVALHHFQPSLYQHMAIQPQLEPKVSDTAPCGCAALIEAKLVRNWFIWIHQSSQHKHTGLVMSHVRICQSNCCCQWFWFFLMPKSPNKLYPLVI